MSNAWFQFKQFTVTQDKCAMKVTTDACIQAAWTPIGVQTERVLDIGTGTGLLSLMLAQRQPTAKIDTVEYDPDAAEQAIENFKASPWEQRVQLTNCDIKDYYPAARYDLIICNPPFFSNSLLSGRESKDRARHDISLSQKELAHVVRRLLAPQGRFSILLPFTEYQLWTEAAAVEGLTETMCLHVKHTPTSAVKRVVGIFERKVARAQPTPGILIIRNDENAYTSDFQRLLAPFYLAF